MKIIRSVGMMQRYSNCLKTRNKTIGLVPTMGYLHDGHLSLVERSLKENNVTVVSIFVNPTQFGHNEDLKKYPRDFRRDEKMLKAAGTDVVFYPTVKEMYPEPYYTYVNVEYLTDALCGRSRPAHFRGVTTVVAKLFNIVRPDTAYFGQKDAQQAAVIKRMAKDLNMGIKVKTMPIVREEGGLAMSSRNTYLNIEERQDARVLYKSLILARQMVNEGCVSSSEIINKIKMLINQKKSARIDYIEIVDRETLRPVNKIQGSVLIALAVYIGKTRLIDNMSLLRHALPPSAARQGSQ